MEWYFIHPETKEVIYLCLEEWYAEHAWDFRHKRNLCLADLTDIANDSFLETIEDLYELDDEEDALKVFNWIIYFQYNADPNFSGYIEIRKGE